jgi:hypothetical protein
LHLGEDLKKKKTTYHWKIDSSNQAMNCTWSVLNIREGKKDWTEVWNLKLNFLLAGLGEDRGVIIG